MGSSRKPPSASAQAFLQALRGKRIAVGLSGGIDSVVLLHLLRQHRVTAVHVHHGLSPNADAWARFCRRLCRAWSVPLTVRKVRVRNSGAGIEAAARAARYAVFERLDADVVALAHNLDDQAETVLMNLLRGAGVRGAAGMRAVSRFGGKRLARPLLDVPRASIAEYARLNGLEWVEDESNDDTALTRNFVRHRLAPVIETRFPAWHAALARAARHFSVREARAEALLRAFLEERGMRAPSEAKLVEMLRQLTSRGARTRIEHDGQAFRVYRGALVADAPAPRGFEPVAWKGERRLSIPALDGELRFARGTGIDARVLEREALTVHARCGGERLQLDLRRPRRTLKNLFQEAGVPPWERDRLPLIYRGEELVWAPGLGVDVRYRGRGWVPRWIRFGRARKPLF